MDNRGRKITFDMLSNDVNQLVHLGTLDFDYLEVPNDEESEYITSIVPKREDSENAFIDNRPPIKLYYTGNGNYDTKPGEEYSDMFRDDGMKWLEVAKKLVPIPFHDQLSTEKYYLSQEGKVVKFVELKETYQSHATAMTEDKVHYYSRVGGATDNGRVTGTDHNYSYKHNLATDEYHNYIESAIPYREIRTLAGDTLQESCEKLANTPMSFLIFNGVFLNWVEGFTTEDYKLKYRRASYIEDIYEQESNFQGDNELAKLHRKLSEFNEHNKKLNSNMLRSHFITWLIKYLDYRDTRNLSGMAIDGTVRSYLEQVYIPKSDGLLTPNLVFISDNLYRQVPINVGMIKRALEEC